MPVSGNRRGPPRDDGPSLEESMREAQTRPLDFPATERAIYIRAMVRRVKELKAAGRSVKEIRELLPEFVRDYTHLFDMVTQTESFEKELNMMLTMLDRIGQGGLTHHQATVIVADRVGKEHIKPDSQK